MLFTMKWVVERKFSYFELVFVSFRKSRQSISGEENRILPRFDFIDEGNISWQKAISSDIKNYWGSNLWKQTESEISKFHAYIFLQKLMIRLTGTNDFIYYTKQFEIVRRNHLPFWYCTTCNTSIVIFMLTSDILLNN